MEALFGERASRRTLLRRLDDIFQRGEIERIGKARATKYHAIETKLVSKPSAPSQITYEKPRFEPMLLREDGPDLQNAASSQWISPESRDQPAHHRPLVELEPAGRQHLPSLLETDHLLTQGRSDDRCASWRLR